MANLIHGHSSRAEKTPTYRSWCSMHIRCSHRKEYSTVDICKSWFDFSNFLKDMGLRPNNMTLDRINPELGYYKENCRWATQTTQSRNKKGLKGVTKRRNKFIARIGMPGNTNVFLGSFDNRFDAICARKSAENKYWS